MDANRWNASTPIAFLIGMGIGAGLGLLFAPKSGQKTRRDIAKTVKKGMAGIADIADQGAELGADIGHRAKETFENAKEQVQQAADAGGEAYKRVKKALA